MNFLLFFKFYGNKFLSMHEARLRIECKNPGLVEKSLEPDSEKATTELSTGKGFVEIKIKSEKLSYLKALVNSYISLIGMLNDADKVG